MAEGARACITCLSTDKEIPKEERFNLIDQMRRSSTSIAANIAEGCGKHSQKDFVAYLQISQGSSQEIKYLSILSKDLEYITLVEYDDLNGRINEVKAMLISLIQKVRRDNNLNYNCFKLCALGFKLPDAKRSGSSILNYETI